MIFSLINLILSLIIASIKYKKPAERFHKRHPNLLEYKWGFFFGYICIIYSTIGLAFIAIGLLIAPPGIYSEEILVLLIISIVCILEIIIGRYILRRKRWALVVGTIISFNPIIWIINIFYIAKRWKEMA